MANLSQPTLQELVTETRDLLNQPNPANSFWADEEITRYLNEGIRRYFVEVAQKFEGQFTSQADLDITQDTELVALPTDFYEMRSLYKKVENGYIILPYKNNLTESYSTSGGTANNTYFPYYYFRGNNIVLRPVPQFNETGGLRIEYTAFPETLVTGQDAMTSGISPVFRELITTFAAYKAKVKEAAVNGTATEANFKRMLDELQMAFKDAVTLRSKSPTFVVPYSPENEG